MRRRRRRLSGREDGEIAGAAPRHDRCQVTTTTMTAPDPRAATSVLLVEEDEDLRDLLVQALRRDGHEVIIRRSSTELLGALELPSAEGRAARLVDVIVWDVPRPGRPGLLDVAKLRAAGRTVPVILLTALEAPGMRHDARRLGVIATFVKPFDLDDLRTVVLNTARVA